MKTTRRVLGSLECVVCEPSEEPRGLAVFCHGFGAPGTDLVPLAQDLAVLSKPIAEHLVLMFPAAPLEMRDFGPGSRAWWPIRFAQLQAAMMSGDFTDLKNFIPDQLFEMRDRLSEAVSLLAGELGLVKKNCVLGGFSQGAMLATETVLADVDNYGGLIIWSGTLLSVDRWTDFVPRHQGVPVLQSHGTFDQMLPFELAVELKALLADGGMSVGFHAFPQGHSIANDVLEESAKFLSKICEATP